MAPAALSPIEPASDMNGQGRKDPSRLFTLNDRRTIETLSRLSSRTTNETDYPHAKSVISNIPIYDLGLYDVTETTLTDALQDEFYHILSMGPGVFILKNFFSPSLSADDENLINRVNVAYDSIIASELVANGQKGDHFAASGKNSRIWNSFQKHATVDPTSFVHYYSNPWLSVVSEAWLGPAYTVTAQVNIVKPGGAPQMPHRDYHLGFQTAEDAARWPRGMHLASQYLTLQGAVAHSDMPLSSGPTRFLPFSQLLPEGFVSWRREGVKDLFHDKWVSAPLDKGDAVFFNPALLHAAGENVTSIEKGDAMERSANLLQISSAFGKTMETIDHVKIVEACWDSLTEFYGQEKGMTSKVLSCVKTMTMGYPFPTNLDRRPPAPRGMAPESETDVVLKGLKLGWDKKQAMEAMSQLRKDSSA